MNFKFCTNVGHSILFYDKYGDFWHGHNWAIRGMNSLDEELERYSLFWRDKILGNIQRDQENTTCLENDGWVVLRLWESEIKDNVEKCATIVEKRYRSAIANHD